MLTLIMAAIHGILMMGVLALTYEYYGKLEDIVLPEIIHLIVYVGVLGVSVVWALIHALGGAIMGATAGGVWSGIRLGLSLGLLMSVGRLWPYIFTFALGAYLCSAAIWEIVGSLMLGIICAGIHFSTKFIWNTNSI